MEWWCHKYGWKGISTSLVKPFFEFHIHSDYHVRNIKVNTVVLFPVTKLFQFPLFSDSKKCSHVAKPPLRPYWLTLPLLPCPHARSHWLSPRFSFPGLGIVKTSATSQWAFDSENMTAVTKKPQDARELKVHTAGAGDSLVHLTFCQKTAGELACERAK